jgi:hypothetical protein
MIKHSYISLICLSLVTWWTAQGMVFDNRYLPLYHKPYTRRIGSWSHIRLQPFFMRADRAQGSFEDGSIPDINGRYDQIEIGKALVTSGCLPENPFRSDLQGISSIPWKREGRIDAEGLAFFYEQPLGHPWLCGPNFSVGLSLLFMHISAHHEFCLDSSCIDALEGDRQYLFALKDRMNQALGVTPPLFSKTGFGDIDFYLRYGVIYDYIFKFRRVDAGIKLGALFPTATDISLDNPAAIPFGGGAFDRGRFWGIYIGLESEVELKEDWYFGIQFRASKRFPRTVLQRMPTELEPTQYGTIVGHFRINPGFTFVFNPYISFEGLREGFGLKALYTVVAHLEDRITDRRTDTTIPVKIDRVQERSSWGMEHVTIGAFYDFAKQTDCRSWLPTVSVYWDIPVDWVVSKRSSRTNSVSLMVEIDF